MRSSPCAANLFELGPADVVLLGHLCSEGTAPTPSTCAGGSYRAAGEAACLPCTPRHYCPEGATQPLPCPAGTVDGSDSTGLSSADECGSGNGNGSGSGGGGGGGGGGNGNGNGGGAGGASSSSSSASASSWAVQLVVVAEGAAAQYNAEPLNLELRQKVATLAQSPAAGVALHATDNDSRRLAALASPGRRLAATATLRFSIAAVRAT